MGEKTDSREPVPLIWSIYGSWTLANQPPHSRACIRFCIHACTRPHAAAPCHYTATSARNTGANREVSRYSNSRLSKRSSAARARGSSFYKRNISRKWNTRRKALHRVIRRIAADSEAIAKLPREFLNAPESLPSSSHNSHCFTSVISAACIQTLKIDLVAVT